MKINWDAKITDFEGVAIKDGEKDLTLKALACAVFMTALRGDENMSGDEKEKLFKIGLAATNGGVGEITTDEASSLKKRIGNAYPPLIVGRAFEIIEGSGEEKKSARLVKSD
jgi:hypothetical protein